MKKRNKKGFSMPGWLLLVGMSVYTELILHLWTTPEPVPLRLAAVVIFALGCGLGLGLIPSLFKPRAEKWVAVFLGFLMGALGLLQYFLNDAYTVFMPMHSVFAGAEGVATGYFATMMGLLAKSIWRILLVELPVLLYAIFARPQTVRGRYQSVPKFRWRRALALIAAAVALYAAGFSMVIMVGRDKPMLSSSYSFDGAVRCFGLNVGMILEPMSGLPLGEEEFEFEVVPPAPAQPATQATEPPETEPRDPDTTEPDETTVPTEPPKVLMPHAYDLDYGALAEKEASANPKVSNLHRYVSTLTPTMENEYTGLFAGKNLIFITAEAFTKEVIDPELTPTLYRMANEGIRFDDYYQILTGCSTTGGEYTNLLGLAPYGGVDSMREAQQQYLFLTMGHQLGKLGYATAAFHNNDHTYYNRHQTHTLLGYDRFFAWGNGMEGLITDGWPRSDKEMMDVTLPEYLDQQPFHLYYMSVSGHSTYGPNNMMGAKNFDKVEHLPFSKTVRYYLAANLELEYAVEAILNMLEEAGIADNTVIVIGSDHYPYGLAAGATWGDGTDHVSELFGVKKLDEPTRDHNALIIWSPCLEDMDLVVEEPVYSLDILPTLSNLFGLEYDSRLMPGRDVLSDQEALVIWNLTASWKTDKGFYDASKGKFTPREGVTVEEGYVDRINAIVYNKIYFCREVAYRNYYNYIAEAMGFAREE